MAKPRVPTETKIIQGTFRTSEAPQARLPSLAPLSQMPRAPRGFPKRGRELWKRLAPELVEKQLLTVLDLPAFEVLCALYAIYFDLHQAITTTTDANGRSRPRSVAEYLKGKNSQTSPELVAMRKAASDFRAMAAEFGITPHARGGVAPAAGKKTDSAEEEMNRLLDGKPPAAGERE